MAKKSTIFDVIQGIADNATYTGTAGADTITTTFNNNTLNGAGGNDVIITTLSNRSDDLLYFQNGAAGSDNLLATVNATSRYLGGVQRGGAGVDTITTNTTLTNPFNDTLLETYALGGNGNDTISMTAALNSGGLLWQEAYGEDGDDTVTLNASTTGGAGTIAYNYAEGGIGNDRLEATIVGNANATVFNELYGDDGVYPGLLGPASNDTLIGRVVDGAGADSADGVSYLYGGYGNDSLRVYGGNENELYGGQGNDELRGGSGTDYFVGGDGIDTFWVGSGGDDMIMDFNFGLLGTFIGSDILRFEPGVDVSLLQVSINPEQLLQISLAGNPLITLAGTEGTPVQILIDLLDLLIGSPIAGGVSGEIPG